MKQILILVALAFSLYANIIKSPILKIEKDLNEVYATFDGIDIGMSGYVSHKVNANHSIIIKSATVIDFDAQNKIAKIKLSAFNMIKNDNLPNINKDVAIGDEVVFAFGYKKALLIAPSEDLYYSITKSSSVEWVHPDIFATELSASGHPTPLRTDFTTFSEDTSTGIIFIYLDKKIYTIDAQSFKILAINDAPLEQKSTLLPFYSRVENIDSAWWGDGSSRLEEYEPHYYSLLIEANKNNKNLFEIVKNSTNKNVQKLISTFDFEGKKDANTKRFILF